ncbi:MAG: TolC family protein, partial [Nitrospirae bacterium]
LEEAVQWAVGRNLGIALEREQVPAAAAEAEAAAAAFDTRLSGEAAFDHTETPTASQLFGTTQETLSLDLALARRFAWGTEARLGLRASRRRDNFPFSILTPRFDAGLELELTQPLLRGAGPTANLAPVWLARVASEAERLRLRAAMERVVMETETAYWRLVEAQAQVEVAQASLRHAQALDRDLAERVAAGALPPFERLGAQAEVALRREGVAVARQGLEDARDRLLEAAGIAGGDLATWSLRPEPAPLPPANPEPVDEARAVAYALDHRTDLAIARLARRRRAIEAARADRDRLPELTLSGRAGVGALTGDREIQDLLDQLGRRDFLSYRVGLRFAYPLGNRAGRARAEAAHHRHRAADLDLARLRVAAVAAVRAAVRAVGTAAERVRATGEAVAASRARLDAWQERFHAGSATPRQVVEAQRDLAEARGREVAARTAYLLAVARLWDEEGRLLERHHLAVRVAPGR